MSSTNPPLIIPAPAEMAKAVLLAIIGKIGAEIFSRVAEKLTTRAL
jgi:hypothetical protein